MAGRRKILALALVALASVAVAKEMITDRTGDMTGEELAEQLSGTWIITKVAHADIPEGAVPTLVFDPEELGGFAGCNNFGVEASYDDNGAVEFGDPTLTENVCGMAAMELESQIVNALQLIDRADFDAANGLALSSSGDMMIRAERPKDK